MNSTTRYVLARLAFPCLIIAGWLAYEGYLAQQGRRGPVSNLRIGTYFLAAILSLSLSMMAFRERYRRPDRFRGDDDDRRL
jgi:hypothetical protein